MGCAIVLVIEEQEGWDVLGGPGQGSPDESWLYFHVMFSHDGVLIPLDFLDSNVFNTVISGGFHFDSTRAHSTEGGVTRPLSHRSPVHILKPALTSLVTLDLQGTVSSAFH